MSASDSGGSVEVWSEPRGWWPRSSAEQVRQNGWSLWHSSPDARRKVTQNLQRQHAQHVVVLLRSSWVADACVKFLVAASLTLAQLKASVGVTFQVPVATFHVVFDGVSYPDSNVMGALYARQARADGILHGFLVPLDPGSQTLVGV